MKVEHLTATSEVNRPAPAQLIGALEAELAKSLPAAYRDLLLAADGMLFDNGLVLYPASQIRERNETFEVEKYAPGFLAIGDDSGGRAIMISLDSEGVFVVGIGRMDPVRPSTSHPTRRVSRLEPA